MRKETAADSGPRTSVRGRYCYRRSNRSQLSELRARLAGQLTIPVMALALAAALAACGSAAPPPSPPAGSDSQSAAAAAGRGSASSGAASSTASKADVLAAARRVKCPSLVSGISPRGRYLRAKPIPAGFRPLAVVECIRVPGIVPVDGPEPGELRRVAVSGLSRLVAALRLPATPRTRGLVPACLMPVDRASPWIVFIGPGDHLLRPRIPTGACGLPIVPVQVALNSLHWQTLSPTQRMPVSPRPVNGSPFPNINPAITAAQPGALP